MKNVNFFLSSKWDRIRSLSLLCALLTVSFAGMSTELRSSETRKISAVPALGGDVIVTSNPSNTTVCVGGTTSFTVVASNVDTYQWQVNQGAGYLPIANGGRYSNATTATLTISGALGNMTNYTYRCLMTAVSPYTPAVTTPATLTVRPAPSFTQYPSSNNVCENGAILFYVAASNTTGYQWQANAGAGFVNISDGPLPSGTTYANTNTAVLYIENSKLNESGTYYRCVISGLCTPNAVSAAAEFTVLPNVIYYEDYDGDGYGNAASPLPRCSDPGPGYVTNNTDCNDNNASVHSAPSITLNPSNSTVCAGTNTSFSVTASSGVNYQWQVNDGAGYINISNGGVYSNATTATLNITGVDAGLNGYTYRCIVSNACSPAAVSTEAALAVNSAPSITQNPYSGAVCQGDAILFNVNANNATGYQWQVNDGAGYVNISDTEDPEPGQIIYSGTNSYYMIANNIPYSATGYSYRCVVSGTCTPNTTSTGASLTVYENVVYYEDFDGDGYGNAAVTTLSCVGAQTGYVANSDDCDDNDSGVYPGAVEICGDGIDNNCDGNVDEDCTTQIASVICGTTLEFVNSLVQADAVSGATNYRFRVTNGASVQTIDKGTSSFSFTELASHAYNTTYTIDVAVDLGSGFGAYGSTCDVTTPFMTTEVQAAQCGTTLSALNAKVYANNINGATQYRFRLIEGATVQTIDKSTRSFNMTELAFFNYATTYTVDVAVETGGVWGSYGPACNITTPPLNVQVQAAQCGATLASLSTSIYATSIAGATAYRFRVTNGASVQVIENASRILVPSQITGNGYNMSYSIEVAAEFNGMWSDYGSSCNVNMPVAASKVQAAQCGTTLVSASTVIYAENVPGATQYRFRVVNGANVQTIDRPTRSFSLTQLASYDYTTTYTVDVAVEVNGSWGTYGTACNVSTPALATQVQSAQCGTTLTSLSALIYANNAAGATEYRFRVTNGANVQTIDKTTRSFSLTQLASYEYGTTYTIDVAVMFNGVWQAYGAACSVTTPAPVTTLQSANCGATVTRTTIIYALNFAGATQYRFRFTEGANVITVDKPSRSLPLGTVTALANNTAYTVDVAVYYNGTWQPYGPACGLQIGTPVVKSGDTELTATAFDAVVYPNPFGSEFGINVSTESTEAVRVSVYDITGKLMTGQTVAAEELNSLRIGSDYAAGIYQVIVTQGTEVKTLRVVKQ